MVCIRELTILEFKKLKFNHKIKQLTVPCAKIVENIRVSKKKSLFKKLLTKPFPSDKRKVYHTNFCNVDFVSVSKKPGSDLGKPGTHSYLGPD